jgi:hypothetical protein
VKRHHEAGCNPINFVVIALLPRRALQVFDFHRLDLHGDLLTSVVVRLFLS